MWPRHTRIASALPPDGAGIGCRLGSVLGGQVFFLLSENTIICLGPNKESIQILPEHRSRRRKGGCGVYHLFPPALKCMDLYLYSLYNPSWCGQMQLSLFLNFVHLAACYWTTERIFSWYMHLESLWSGNSRSFFCFCCCNKEKKLRLRIDIAASSGEQDKPTYFT